MASETSSLFEQVLDINLDPQLRTCKAHRYYSVTWSVTKR